MAIGQNFVLRCSGCGREYPFGTYTCENFDGVLLAEFEVGKARSVGEIEDPSNQGIWRFSKVLPNVHSRISFAEGWTPCVHSRVLGPKMDLSMYIKDEGRNPTGSFKDRAGSLLVSTERELGHTSCATASSGNAAGALALYSRLAEIQLYVFMYQPTPEKLLHTLSFGHKIFLVDTPVESDVHRLTELACRRFGWSWLTTMSSANPFNVEGYKTIAYEIVQDVGLPDIVALPVGSGTLALGVWKGFKELHVMGVIPELPRLVGVQAEQIKPVVLAFERGDADVQAITPGKTAATGVVVDNPGAAGAAALQAVRESEGHMVAVPEEKILAVWSSLPSQEGIFSEPTGSLSIAGVVIAREAGVIKAGEKVVCVNSANGFKDIGLFKTIKQRGSQMVRIPPDIEAVAKLVGASD